MEAAFAFLSICQGKNGPVKQQLSQACNERVKKNRAALVSIVKTIVLCERQNLAVRGHTDDRSNFCALLDYKSEDDTLLREHLETSPEMHAT